MINIASTLGF